MAEIQTLSKSWSELEEQNTRKILNLSKIEDYKLHYKEEVRLFSPLVQECEVLIQGDVKKSKMEHKCQLLTREVSIANNAQVALKKQSEKQLELIVKLQDQNKLVSDHLVCFLRHISLNKSNAMTGHM